MFLLVRRILLTHVSREQGRLLGKMEGLGFDLRAEDYRSGISRRCEWDRSLTHGFSSELERLVNILGSEVGVRVEDFRVRHAFGDQAHHGCDGNTQTANALYAAHLIRCNHPSGGGLAFNLGRT
jgi:hypothetical protein